MARRRVVLGIELSRNTMVGLVDTQVSFRFMQIIVPGKEDEGFILGFVEEGTVSGQPIRGKPGVKSLSSGSELVKEFADLQVCASASDDVFPVSLCEDEKAIQLADPGTERLTAFDEGKDAF